MEGSGRKRFSQYLVILIYAGLLGSWAWHFYAQVQASKLFSAESAVDAAFQGNDWVVWDDRAGQVIARRVHPLPAYKSFPPETVRPGDQLRKIDYQEVLQSEMVENISRNAPPGKILLYQVARSEQQGDEADLLNIRVVNGFRLAFNYNRIGTYWRIGVWMAGIGTFVAFLILLILYPFIRSDWRHYLPLLLVVGLGLVVFALQLGHSLYLIIESDLVDTSLEKGFSWFFSLLTLAYALAFFYLHITGLLRWLILPSLLLAGYFLMVSFGQVFGEESFKYYHEILERHSLLFFLIHISVPVSLDLLKDQQASWLRRNWGTALTAIWALALFVFFWQLDRLNLDAYEHGLMLFNVLLFFPLSYSAYARLRFGKVSLVVTRSLQYLAFIGLCLFLYALIDSAFQYVFPSNPYRELMVIITLLGAIALGFGIYRSNSGRLSQYFVTSQQQKEQAFAAFIATIPQYTSSSSLLTALQEQSAEYFEADPIELWWSEDNASDDWGLEADKLYPVLAEKNSVWSQNKELSALKLEAEQEQRLLRSLFSLIAPIQVSDGRFGLLLLGRKKKGVYNLSDLEQISQLLQQTQLTLNVLQLLQRERELMQQTYEANLTVLRSQINPHFLFNTLNTISALIHDSPDLAEEAVEKLAFIFRYTLKYSNQNLVSLENELKLVSTYLDIEKIRFGERLNIQIESEPALSQVQLPAFVLQTLVENCIKHGIAKIIGRGIVSIDAFIEEGYMICEVYDNGPGIDPDRITQSTGLNNIIARLENIYGIKNLLYFENTGNGTRVQVKIPLDAEPETAS